MALASQTLRAADRNRNMTSSRRRRGPVSRLIAIVVLAAIAGLAWWLIRGGAISEPSAPDHSNVSAREPGAGTQNAPRPGASSTLQTPPTSRDSILTPEPANDTPTPRATAPAGEQNPPIQDEASHASARGPDDAPVPKTAQVTEPSGPDDKSAPTDTASSAATGELAKALALISSDPLAARRQLTRVLDGSALTTAERLRAYEAINEVNQPLFFRSGVVQGDTVFVTHKVESGETPVSIVRAMSANCESDLLLRVNEIADARRVRVGQVLKVPKGVFHGEVRKGEFRINLFHGEGADRVMVVSFPVGLGEFNTTPTGIFKVRPRSKLKDPQWRNPRTGEFFNSDDPKNPIGERWIGLEGIEPHNQDFAGYGIHGTIEPESIGQMRSMGCVRMRAPDVEVVYEMLTAPNSTILIAP